MKFTEPVRSAKFLKRYKRFFADVEIDGQTVVSHVANTGSLKTCLFEGCEAIVTESSNPERKLKATLQFLKTPTGWAGVNTSLPNALVHEAWEQGLLEHWREFKAARREFKLSKETRLDMVLAMNDADLENKTRLHHIEVKNVTYAEDGVASFPDAETERGQKHLRELTKLKNEGHGAEIVFVIQREGCHSFAPADHIDAEYGRLLREAVKAGVRVTALACKIDPAGGIELHPEPLKLKI